MASTLTRYVAPASPHNALWRLFAGLCLIAAVYIAGTFGMIYALGQRSGLVFEAMPGQDPASVLLLLGTFLPLVGGVWLTVRVLHRQTLDTVMGEGWQADALRALLLLGLLQGTQLWIAHRSGLQTEPNLNLTLWLRVLPAALVLTSIQTLAEELLFRGYLVQQLGARFGLRWLAIGLPAVLFGFAHTQPSVFEDAWIYPVLAAMVFGLVAGDLTVRRANIGAAWGLHLANNVMALSIVATGPAMSGLALRLSPLDLSDLADRPWLLALDLIPLLIAWRVLR